MKQKELIREAFLKARKKIYSIIAPTRTLHCLGDSHVMVFEYIAKAYKNEFRHTEFKFCIIPGATNMGLANPHAQTQAGPIFSKYINNEINAGDTVLFMLGEIDCGFVIWYRLQKYGLTIEEQFRESLDNYFKLLDIAKQKAGRKIIVCDAPLPTLKDEQKELGEVANKRLEVRATLRERTELTLSYNKKIHAYCRNNQFQILHYQNELMNISNRTVSDFFLNDDPMNHHLSNEKWSVIIVDKLKQLKFY